jgi:hypothetical protein
MNLKGTMKDMQLAAPVYLPEEKWHVDDVIISLLGSGA